MLTMHCPTVSLMVGGSSSLLLQLLQFFLQQGQTCHHFAVSFVVRRLLFDLLPSGIGLMLIPRLLGVRIERPKTRFSRER